MNPLEELFPIETIKKLPLNYQFITKKGSRDGATRIKDTISSFYNSESYLCIPFYKPISRVRNGEKI